MQCWHDRHWCLKQREYNTRDASQIPCRSETHSSEHRCMECEMAHSVCSPFSAAGLGQAFPGTRDAASLDPLPMENPLSSLVPGVVSDLSRRPKQALSWTKNSMVSLLKREAGLCLLMELCFRECLCPQLPGGHGQLRLQICNLLLQADNHLQGKAGEHMSSSGQCDHGGSKHVAFKVMKHWCARWLNG